jgi:CO/xanthine dehydrogenase Mo-binding subunit
VRYNSVGKRLPRLDAPDHVTGQTRFTADLTLPGMVWGAVVRSSEPHARVVSVDTETASAMPGVLAVVAGAQSPGPSASSGSPRRDRRGPPRAKSRGGLAREKVRYFGEAIAAVAAETLEQAETAARAVVVRYQPLPLVPDVRSAIRPDAARVHERSESREYPNVCEETTVKRGDIAAGFAAADHVFEDTFETPWVHQGYLEPHVAIADWDAAGHLTVWTSTQAQFGVRSALARSFSLPEVAVRVIGMPVGGGFGGKGGVMLEPIAAALARQCGRPVKLVMTREEEFLANRPCGGSVLELRTGVKRDGEIVALQARLLFDTGAYRGAQAGTGAMLVQGPYRIPNLLVTAYSIYTNKPSAGARRALTGPHVHFAIESQLDIIAHALGTDPLELRLKNVIGKGDPVVGGATMPYSLPEKVIRAALRQAQGRPGETAEGHPERSRGAAAERAGWSRRPFGKLRVAPATQERAAPSEVEGRRGPRPGSGKARGIGMAAGHWTCWAGGSSASVHLNDDGTVSVVTGAINLSGTDTSFAQIAAESFGLPVERVMVTQGDTDSGTHNDGSHHSRVLFGVGEAVRRACEEAKRQLAEALAEELGVSPTQVQFAGGRLRAASGRSLSLAEAAGQAIGFRGAIVGQASLTELPFSISSAAQVAEVEVDRETGQWQLVRLTCAQDVGFAINPMSVEGQIEGGASHGLGYALSEQYLYEDGRLLNRSFRDFRMPTSLDHPDYEIALVEEQVDGGPFGAKGVGEPPTIPTAAAIANAIFDAIGVRVRELPITPERLLAGLTEVAGRSRG